MGFDESDDDDYDYGNDRYETTNATTNTTTETPMEDSSTSFSLLDPYILSKPQSTQRTIENMILCIHSLLNELSHHKLSHLSIGIAKCAAGATSASTTKTLWGN